MPFASYNQMFGLGSHAKPSTLELWLPLQETTGTVAVDQSGKGRNGTSVAGAAPAAGQGPNSWLQNAWQFSGMSYLSLPTTVMSGDNYSLLCRAKINQHPPGTSPNTGFGLFGQARVTGQGSHYTWTDGKIYDATWRGASSTATSRVNGIDGEPSLTQFRRVAIKTTPGAGGWRYRIDGTTLATTAGLTNIYTSDIWAIGWSSGGGSQNYYLQGNVCNFAVFSEHLSDGDEVEESAGPEPLNTVAGVASISGDNLSWTNGSWDSQLNGPITYTYSVRRNGVTVATPSASPIDISGFGAGNYDVLTRGSNNGGHDAAEDTPTNTVAYSPGGPTANRRRRFLVACA